MKAQGFFRFLYYWGLYRDYYTDPFPHSLLSTRESGGLAIPGFGHGFRALEPDALLHVSSGGGGWCGSLISRV